MTIYGVSQTTGAERRLNVALGGEGVVLTFTDHAGGKERGSILVQADDLLAAVTDPLPEGLTVEGIAPPHGEKLRLRVEVRRNEVLLTLGGPANASDAAVGLDDFQDALEGVITRG